MSIDIDAMVRGFVTAALWSDCIPFAAPVCPDCGEPIELVPSGAWWRHVGAQGNCWKLSYDGPREPDEHGGLQHLEPSPEVNAWARDICERFVKAAEDDDIEQHMSRLPDPDGGAPEEYIGHTLYLQGAGHGVSFTDRAWRDDDPATEVCKRLSEVANGFREIEHQCIFESADRIHAVL